MVGYCLLKALAHPLSITGSSTLRIKCWSHIMGFPESTTQQKEIVFLKNEKKQFSSKNSFFPPSLFSNATTGIRICLVHNNTSTKLIFGFIKVRTTAPVLLLHLQQGTCLLGLERHRLNCWLLQPRREKVKVNKWTDTLVFGAFCNLFACNII